MRLPIPPWIHPGKIASRVVDKIRAQGIIPSGPFRGFPASEEALEGNWSHLLGVYEIQLHDTIESFLQRRYRLIVDVGGAYGYYAIGFALRLPQAKVVVFESEPRLQAAISRYALRAGVEARMDVRGHCHPEELEAAIREENEGLLMMDCEGGERELLGEKLLPALSSWRILVELHDWHAPGAAEEIRGRFQKTHMIEEIWTRDLRADDFNFLLKWPMTYCCLPSLRRMCSEGRGVPMRYYFMEPKGTGPVSTQSPA